MQPLRALLWRPLTYVAVFSLFVNLLLLAPALFILQLFDRVLVSQSRETLLMLLLGMAVALTLMLVLDHLRGRLQGVAGNLLGEFLSPIVARAMLGAAARRGEVTTPDGMRDVAALRNLFSAQGLLALFDAPWVVVYVGVIWLAHPLLGVASLLAAVLMLTLALANDRLTRGGIEAVQRESSRATRYLESSLQNADVVHGLGMADSLIARWRARNANVTRLQGPTARRAVAMSALTRTTRQAVQVLLQALGAYLVITGDATPGIMVASTILLGRALAPVEQLVGSWRVLAEGRLALRRVHVLLRGAELEPARMALPPPTGRLEAQGLVYRLPGSGRVILAGVSLALEPGEALAVIGPSGAGKSTLARLLTGVWAPQAGVVRLDHVDLAQWPRAELGPWLGYLPQAVELFAGTVAENIARLGAVDSEQVVRAARRAGAHEMILELPEGYDTLIEATGQGLSPGQRQRIGLARALYGDPRLVVFDEPNANLDGAGELALSDALRALRGHVTAVVITHRRMLIQHVDKVLVLEAGRTKLFGTAADVMQALVQPAAASAGQVVAMPRPVAGGVG